MASINSRIAKLRARKTDLETGVVKLKETRLAKSIAQAETPEDAAEYVKESMEQVSEEYTEKTFEECKRVEDQLKEAFETESISVSFEHQGSVTNDTHIKFYSDIDLLVLAEAFIDLKPPLQVTQPYNGDPVQDMLTMRSVIEKRLASSFHKATVDTSGDKAVAISGGSLRRKIDVVPSSWMDTSEYRRTRNRVYRGVKVFDRPTRNRITNFPFLHNQRIEDKDVACTGNLRKLIRFVKSVRSDSDQDIKISSYDIAGICFAMSPTSLNMPAGSELKLGLNFVEFGLKVLGDSSLRQTLMVPNETRLLFGESGLNEIQFKVLVLEAFEVLKLALRT